MKFRENTRERAFLLALLMLFLLVVGYFFLFYNGR